MRDVRQPVRNWVFALLGLLLLTIVVFLYVTGGRLPGLSNSPTAEISGKSAQ
jgi:ABC-type transporter Mla subunit MlaD